ncbi:MAG: hypothetical protein EOO66_14820 [Methylobacterium sp.]|nr:MAG: hypothetical protein EOO66_14820 [Methylobacterium sp.]
MTAAEGPALTQDQEDALRRIGGLQAAATLLMQRLYEKDRRRWTRVVMMSPPDVVPWPEQPDFSDLGRVVRGAVVDGRAVLRTVDGVVHASLTK